MTRRQYELSISRKLSVNIVTLQDSETAQSSLMLLVLYVYMCTSVNSYTGKQGHPINNLYFLNKTY